MDFALTDDQTAIRDLATEILRAEVTLDRLQQLEAGQEHFDRKTWHALGQANLLGLSIPPDTGGSGLGLLEACLVAQEVGRTVALVPYLASTLMAAPALAESGSAAQRARWLPRLATGDAVATVALVDDASGSGSRTTARRTADGWRLDGAKMFVPYGGVADVVLVSALVDSSATAVFLLDPTLPGVSNVPLTTTSGQPESRFSLVNVELGDDDLVGTVDDGAAIVSNATQRGTAGLCVTMAGVCAEALRLTAAYVKERRQFDRPIGTFQAVGHRAADAYIDTEAITLTAWQAVSRLDEGRNAADEIAIAKFWAAEAGQRVVHAAQHLHGGIGVDRQYPLHRYFVWAKHAELTLGGGTTHLLELGRRMAERA